LNFPAQPDELSFLSPAFLKTSLFLRLQRTPALVGSIQPLSHAFLFPFLLLKLACVWNLEVQERKEYASSSRPLLAIPSYVITLFPLFSFLCLFFFFRERDLAFITVYFVLPQLITDGLRHPGMPF